MIFNVMPNVSKTIFLLGLTAGLLIKFTVAFSAGFYLQELGTPSIIGTAGTARTTNNYGAETAFGNPAGMTGIDKGTVYFGSQILVP